MKNTRMAKAFSGIISFMMTLFPIGAQASTAEGKVSWLLVRQSDGLIYTEIAGSRTTPPACATGQFFMIKSESGEAGKQQLAMLMSAQLSGKTVKIFGLGTCTRWPDGEDIEVVAIIP